MGNNTQGDDPEYSTIWGIGRARVEEANLGIILPILAVLSLACIAIRKRKK
ncbi:MAG: hypothetical protein GOP50_07350 [Candidatus Heimdallarchaeota archaeon]|nr:hypothetical protein [Candidatus Heimdallarchaeota archaeon]